MRIDEGGELLKQRLLAEEELVQLRATQACILHDLRLLEERAGNQQLSPQMFQQCHPMMLRRHLEVQKAIEELVLVPKHGYEGTCA